MKEFLEPHERLKELRKRFKITQKELAGDVYTQGYITSLERGVKRIREQNIIDLVKRFNDILREKRIDYKVEIEDIQKDKVDIENEYVENLILTFGQVEDKDEFLKKYREIKIKLNMINEKSQVSLFNKLLELSKKFALWEEMKEITALLIMKQEEKEHLENFGKAFLDLTRACVMTEDADYINPFEENYFEKLDYTNLYEKERIFFNLAMVFNRTVYRRKSLFYLEKLMKLDYSHKREVDLLMEKAYILTDLGEKEEAKQIYNYIIRKNNRDRDYLIWAKLNLSSVFMRENNTEKVKKNYSFLKKEVEEGNDYIKGASYNSLGDIANFLGKKNDAINFYEKSLNYALDDFQWFRENEYIETFDKLFVLYKKKDIDKVEKYKELFNKVSKDSNRQKGSFAFMSYYLRVKHYEYLDLFLKLYKKLSDFS